MGVEAATSYPFLSLMWTMLVFFGWIIWFWLLITIFADLFRRRDTSGWAKAGWTVLVLCLPFIGVLMYLIVESRGMAERRMEEATVAQSQFDDYVRTVATTPSNGSAGSAADQITKAKQLLDSGVINEAEYDALKQKALVG